MLIKIPILGFYYIKESCYCKLKSINKNFFLIFKPKSRFLIYFSKNSKNYFCIWEFKKDKNFLTCIYWVLSWENSWNLSAVNGLLHRQVKLVGFNGQSAAVRPQHKARADKENLGSLKEEKKSDTHLISMSRHR